MKTFFSTRVLACCAAGILLLSHPLYAAVLGEVPEDTAAPSPLQEKALLELRADDIIDSEDFTPTIINADGKIENLPVRTRYYYAGDQTDKTVYQKGTDYSNMEILPDGRYRVYSADTFVYDAGLSAWRTIENATIDPAAFETVMLEQVDPTLGDLLSGTFHAHAQEDPIYPEYDARVYQWNAAGTWSSVQSATDGNGTDNPSADNIATAKSCYAGNWCIIRGLLNFDTSALDGTVESTSLFVYGVSKEDTGNGGLDIVGSTWDGTISNDDYNDLGTTLYAESMDLGDFATDAWNEFVFNATGIAAVDVDGDTKIGARISYDRTGTEPSGDNGAVVRWSEYTGTDYDPYLEITLGEPPAATSTPQASTTPNYIDFENVLILYMVGGLLLIFLLGSLYAIWPTSNY